MICKKKTTIVIISTIAGVIGRWLCKFVVIEKKPWHSKLSKFTHTVHERLRLYNRRSLMWLTTAFSFRSMFSELSHQLEYVNIFHCFNTLAYASAMNTLKWTRIHIYHCSFNNQLNENRINQTRPFKRKARLIVVTHKQKNTQTCGRVVVRMNVNASTENKNNQLRKIHSIKKVKKTTTYVSIVAVDYTSCATIPANAAGRWCALMLVHT